MRFAIMIEPQQGLSYRQQLDVARRAEAAGFDTFYRSDHYRSFPGPPGRPTTDAWTVLAGIARETERIRLGALVSPVTFRHPGSFAKVVTTVDEMSGGRIDVGCGAGWNEEEHVEHGLAFPPIKERADLLEEQLEVLHGLWTQPEGWSFEGRHIQLRHARLAPRPVQQPHPPVLVGGEGSPRSLRIAARWADEFNVSSSTPEQARDIFRRLDAACEAIGRDPGTMRRSAMVGVLVGSDEASYRRRLVALLEMLGMAPDAADAFLDARRPRWIIGTPDEARARAREFADAGTERIMLQDFLPLDLEMIDDLGRELIGRV